MRFPVFFFSPFYRMWSLHCRKIQLKKGNDVFSDRSCNDRNRLFFKNVHNISRGAGRVGAQKAAIARSHMNELIHVPRKKQLEQCPLAPKQQLLYYDDNEYKFTMVYCESVNLIGSFTVFYLTNRFHVAVHLSSNRSQMTSKCGKNKKVAHEAIAECVTDVLTTFWRPLWSITGQMYGNMESICFI